jgi:succinate dehydrogenase/fumarate reductase flavoprotein subunit
MGGVHADKDGRSSIEGLFAAGEAAAVSIHGANRLGSNSLAELLVFGARTGRVAAEYAAGAKAVSSEKLRLLAEDQMAFIKGRYLESEKGTERVGGILSELRKVMDEKVGIYRTEERLAAAVEDIRRLKERFPRIGLTAQSGVFNTEILQVMELDNMLEIAHAVALGALRRKESRGGHARKDFPARDDENFLHHTLAFRTADGPRLEPHPVTITRWQPEERKY